jgi:protein SCO1/2
MNRHGSLELIKHLVIVVGLTLFLLLAKTTIAAPQGSPWNETYFPNIELIDQDGKKLRFYDDLIKNKEVAINFIYTHCGDVCPLETASMSQVQKRLVDRVGKDIFFYSISVDPNRDTPQVLQAYAKRYKAGNGWRFLTGKKQDIILLRKKLGMYRESEEKNVKDHHTSIMIGNEALGIWIKRSPFDDPKALAWTLGYAIASDKTAYRSSRQTSYKTAQIRPKMSRGEDLFRFRCEACHSLGTQDGLGPGLFGVTAKRDKAWLVRWLKAPDKLLAEKDPLAVALYNRYNKVMMPNLRLSDLDIESVLDYMTSHDKDQAALALHR